MKRSFLAIGFFALATLVGLTTTGEARADLIITGGTGTATAGGTGSVDFTISSTTGTDMLTSFNVELQISVLHGNSFLQFTGTQPDPYSRSNYVFAGNSFGNNNSLPFWAPPSTSSTANDTITGGDATADLISSVTISQTPGSLLMAVQYQAATGAAVGDSFSIALVPSSGLGNNGQTSFTGPSPLNYTSTAAVVTLAAPSATPEPSTFALTGLASLGFMFYRRRSRRKNLLMTKSEPAVANLD